MADGNKVITPDGLNRILKAVGKEYCPKNLDRQALVRGIDECIELYCEALKFHNNKYEMSQRGPLETALDLAKRLRQLMKDDSVWHDDRWRHASPQTPRVAIQSLEVLVAQKLAQQAYDHDYEDSEVSWRDSFQLWSPFETLVGDWLPVLYAELGFPNANSPDELASKNGPFIRFARAIAYELDVKMNGRPYAASSFIRAVKNVAAGNVRRALPRELAEVQELAETHRDYLRAAVKSPKWPK
jgi:hypothetical protein